MIDVLISGGLVFDGSKESGDGRIMDIGILDDRIVLVENEITVAAQRTVDARGLLVTPGLIDPHSHSDWSILSNRNAYSTIHQGVTTEIVGNCGVTYAPISEHGGRTAQAALADMGYDGEVHWRSFGELLDAVHDGGTAQNLAWFVGHTALKNAAVDGTYAGNWDDAGIGLEVLLRDALESGAIGISTGLEYGSGRFSTADELKKLSRVTGEYGATYASHIRNRDQHLLAAVDEFFDIARYGGSKAQLSHLNVRHDTGAPAHAWELAAERIYTERERGLDVLADMTPFPSGIGLATGLLPDWLLKGTPEEAARLLKAPDIRMRVRQDSDRYWRFVHKGQWQRVALGSAPGSSPFAGLSFPQLAELTGKDEWDVLFDILSAAGPDMQQVQLLGDLFTEEHLAEAISHPLFLLGVDAYTSTNSGALAAKTRHPLFFHGHTHYLSHHVLKHNVLTMPEAIHKMTGGVAEHFCIKSRGVIRPGYFADIAVFDPVILQETDTFSLPEPYAQAAQWVLVNGEFVVDKGVHTQQLPGRFLPRTS